MREIFKSHELAYVFAIDFKFDAHVHLTYIIFVIIQLYSISMGNNARRKNSTQVVIF